MMSPLQDGSPQELAAKPPRIVTSSSPSQWPTPSPEVPGGTLSLASLV